MKQKLADLIISVFEIMYQYMLTLLCHLYQHMNSLKIRSFAYQHIIVLYLRTLLLQLQKKVNF